MKYKEPKLTKADAGACILVLVAIAVMDIVTGATIYWAINAIVQTVQHIFGG